jgi:hypothetical protein
MLSFSRESLGRRVPAGCLKNRPSLEKCERGWTARLTVDDEVVVYCPECDEREFGDG